MRVRDTRGQITGEALLIALGVALAWFVGTEILAGAKFVGHHTKCGVMRIVGKPCDPPQVTP